MVHKFKKLGIFNTIEGKILLVGVGMSLLLVAVMGYYAIVDTEMSATLGLVFVAHTFGGRAAGIGLCILNELNFFVTIFYNFYLEVFIVFFTYSLFVLSITNHIKLRGVKPFALRLERKARTHKEKIANYGWIGLFLFVMAPLPVTGPVMGAIIGYLLKFKIWRNLSATFLGTLVAIVLWTFFFDFLDQYLDVVRYVFIGIVTIVVLSYLRTIVQVVRSWIQGKSS